MPRNRAWSPLEGLVRVGWYVGTPGMSQIALMPVMQCDVTREKNVRSRRTVLPPSGPVPNRAARGLAAHNLVAADVSRR